MSKITVEYLNTLMLKLVNKDFDFARMVELLNEKATEPEEISFKMPEFDSPKNFGEERHLENGNYVCKCFKCKEHFYGYKRRTICKECIVDAPTQ